MGIRKTQEEESINTTAAEAAEEGTQADTEKGYQLFVYIGPPLPNGTLKSNVILKGGFEEIIAYLGEEVEKYPQIKSLIIPVHKLGEQLQKVKTPGNIINKYYNDVVSATRGKKEV